MKSLNRIGSRPVSLPLSADDIVEFHAARLLLLLNVCGVSGRIDGLTKMAKLDFFVRYPGFFEVARASTAPADAANVSSIKPDGAVESAMVRHHYGPWDKRYYHVLSHLEAKQLITVVKQGKSYRIALTDLGRKSAEALKTRPSFAPITETMREVKKVFGAKNGTFLKNLIYRLFDAEITRHPRGKVIER
jgi:hypothetical protein